VAENSEHADSGDGSVHVELSSLSTKREELIASIELAKDGLRKCKRKSGAAAHKRSWYFENQLQHYERQLEAIDGRIKKLALPGES
jgi:hypothetical protein